MFICEKCHCDQPFKREPPPKPVVKKKPRTALTPLGDLTRKAGKLATHVIRYPGAGFGRGDSEHFEAGRRQEMAKDVLKAIKVMKALKP